MLNWRSKREHTGSDKSVFEDTDHSAIGKSSNDRVVSKPHTYAKAHQDPCLFSKIGRTRHQVRKACNVHPCQDPTKTARIGWRHQANHGRHPLADAVQSGSCECPIVSSKTQVGEERPKAEQYCPLTQCQCWQIHKARAMRKVSIAVVFVALILSMSSCATTGYGCNGKGKLITRVRQ